MLYLISVFCDKLNTLHKCYNVTNRIRYYIENLIEILTVFEKIYIEIFMGSTFIKRFKYLKEFSYHEIIQLFNIYCITLQNY